MIVAIIGGGPAGMNAALMLARSNHRVLLFDNGQPRNIVTTHMHGFLSREGVTPQQFRSIARNELDQFDAIEQIQAVITKVEMQEDSRFLLQTSIGAQYEAEVVIIATGLQEMLPPLDGIEAFYGQTVFSCPFCDGYELSNRRLALITDGANAVALASLLQQWSSKILLFTNDNNDIAAADRDLLQAMNIKIYDRRIKKLVGHNGQLRAVQLEGGTIVSCTGGFVSTYWRQAGAIAEQLGCFVNEQGGIWQDGFGRTNIHRVYVAGDAASISPAQAILAAASGVRAAISVNLDAAEQRKRYYEARLQKHT